MPYRRHARYIEVLLSLILMTQIIGLTQAATTPMGRNMGYLSALIVFAIGMAIVVSNFIAKRNEDQPKPRPQRRH